MTTCFKVITSLIEMCIRDRYNSVSMELSIGKIIDRNYYINQPYVQKDNIYQIKALSPERMFTSSVKPKHIDTEVNYKDRLNKYSKSFNESADHNFSNEQFQNDEFSYKSNKNKYCLLYTSRCV